jgi:Transposase, Mutator family
MDSLDRRTAALLDEEVEAHGAGFRAFGADAMPDRFLGILRHKALQFGPGLFVFEVGGPGPGKDAGEFRPGVGASFTQRDLSEYEIAYLFVDGIAERLRPGGKREPVLAAWGFTVEGRRVLLHPMAGSKEDTETVTAFFEEA